MKSFKTLLCLALAFTLMFSQFNLVIAESTSTPETNSQTTANPEPEATKKADEAEKAEEFNLFNLDNFEQVPFKFAEYKGKVILISMFTVWCPHCKNEMPDFLKLQQEYKESLQVLMVHVQDRETFKTAEDYWAEKDYYDLTLKSDKDFVLAQVFGLRGFPTNLMFDKDGKNVMYTNAVNYDILKAKLTEMGIKPDSELTQEK